MGEEREEEEECIYRGGEEVSASYVQEVMMHWPIHKHLSSHYIRPLVLTGLKRNGKIDTRHVVR